METDKIIKTLRHCSVSGNSCRECPAYNQDSGCLDRLHAQAADLLEEQQRRIAELKEQSREAEQGEIQNYAPEKLINAHRRTFAGCWRKFIRKRWLMSL